MHQGCPCPDFVHCPKRLLTKSLSSCPSPFSWKRRRRCRGQSAFQRGKPIPLDRTGGRRRVLLQRPYAPAGSFDAELYRAAAMAMAGSVQEFLSGRAERGLQSRSGVEWTYAGPTMDLQADGERTGTHVPEEDPRSRNAVKASSAAQAARPPWPAGSKKADASLRHHACGIMPSQMDSTRSGAGLRRASGTPAPV